MRARIYDLAELTESLELTERSPKWWVHALLFGTILVLLSIFLFARRLLTSPGKAMRENIKTNR